MTSDQIKRRFFKGGNFMTPDYCGCGITKSGNYYELSSGSGLRRGTTIFGVTVRNKKGEDQPQSKACFSLEEAEEYIKEL